MSTDLVAAAARSNAEWCRALCAAHGIDSGFSDQLWFSPSRTPRYYPDAVTLDAAAIGEEVLRRVDNSRGCSIKDSYCNLDLTSAGFIELLSAQWIHRAADRPVPATGEEQWRAITDAAALTEWERCWAGDDEPEPDRLFVPGLLDAADVTFAAGYRGDELIGGGIVGHDGQAAHISNVFTTRSDTAASWAGTLAVAAEVAPGVPVFSWERVQYIDPPMKHGFEPIGPLRVWWRNA